MTTSKSEIDNGFLESARNRFNEIGISAIEFIRSYPHESKKAMAELIGDGVTARGLTMKLFEEARSCTGLRNLAQDLLYRKIISEFPDGWYTDENVHTSVKLGSWFYDIHEFAPEYEESAASIIRALTKTDEPEPGWKPNNVDDVRLLQLFEENWSD